MMRLRLRANDLLISLNVLQLTVCFLLLSKVHDTAEDGDGSFLASPSSVVSRSNLEIVKANDFSITTPANSANNLHKLPEAADKERRVRGVKKKSGRKMVNGEPQARKQEQPPKAMLQKKKKKKTKRSYPPPLEPETLDNQTPKLTRDEPPPPVQPQARHSVYDTTLYTLKRTKRTTTQGSSSSATVEWSPPLEAIYDASNPTLYDTIERVFFSQLAAAQDKDDKKKHVQEFLAFLRIPKTGSTSVITLLRNARALYTLDYFMTDEFETSGTIKEWGMQLGCLFGYYDKDHWPDTHDPDYDKTRWICPHVNFGDSLRDMVEALQYLEEDEEEEKEVIIHPFTMVRDPLDRLVSFFYYMYSRRHTDMWKDSFTDEQNQLVADNDLTGWIQSLHDSGMLSVGGGNAMLDQQSYFSQDLRTAQALVHKGRILPLVMECFDVSIKLLADVFPHLLSREYLQEFLTNEEMRHRNERREPKHDDDEEDEEDDEEEEEEDDNEENPQQDQHQSQQQRRLSEEKPTTGGNNKDEIDMNALRMQATQVWMPQQFEFYRTLVLHFTKLVTESLTSVPHTTLTQAEVDQCFATLNDKLGQTAAAAAAAPLFPQEPQGAAQRAAPWQAQQQQQAPPWQPPLANRKAAQFERGAPWQQQQQAAQRAAPWQQQQGQPQMQGAAPWQQQGQAAQGAAPWQHQGAAPWQQQAGAAPWQQAAGPWEQQQAAPWQQQAQRAAPWQPQPAER